MNAAEQSPRQPRRKGRVLVAEAHDITGTLLGIMLDSLGWEAVLARDGVRALTLARQAELAGAPFALALLALNLPPGDGLATARALRRTAASLPIIALASRTSDDEMAAALATGMQGFLTRPLDLGRLIAVIQRCVSPGDTNQGPGPAASLLTTRLALSRWRQRRSEALQAVNGLLQGGALEGASLDTLAVLLDRLASSAALFGEAELGRRAVSLS